jgi:SAM-dependent methyltransferase
MGSCKLCKNNTIQIKLTDIDLQKCVNCGLISDHIDYQEEYLKKVYDELYKGRGKEQHYLSHDREYKLLLSGRTPRIGWHKKKGLEIIRKIRAKNVFEFGSGIGLFGHVLKQYNIEYSSIEFDLDTAGKNMKINGENACSVGSISSFEFKRTYDAIVAFEVVEHLSDLHNALININNGLKNGGSFIFSVPNFDKRLINNNKLSQDRPPIHINFFTKSDYRFLNDYDFEVIAIFERPYPFIGNKMKYWKLFLLRKYIGSTLVFHVVKKTKYK